MIHAPHSRAFDCNVFSILAIRKALPTLVERRLRRLESILTAEQPQNRTQDEAKDDASRKRKIEMEVLPLDDNVTR
jgi:hypothetical protein